IPPGLPGYLPMCPFTLDPTPGGNWSAPNLEMARRLVAASGTRGARIQFWADKAEYDNVAGYAAQVLRDLGYHVQVRERGDYGSYYDYVRDPTHHAQIGVAGWIGDYLTATSFFFPFSCTDPADNYSRFCDHGIESGRAAALAASGPADDGRWAA